MASQRAKGAVQVSGALGIPGRAKGAVQILGSATTAQLTGTVTASIVEADIVSGGKTIILTLTGDTWISAGTGPIGTTAQTNLILANIDSAQAEASGWDVEVKANFLASDLVRTSSTVVTITLGAETSYEITAQETITCTIPAVVMTTSSVDVVVNPTFTVDIDPTGTVVSITDPLTDGTTAAVLSTTNYAGNITTLSITGDQTNGGTSTLSITSATGDSTTFDADVVTALTSITAGTTFDTTYWTNTATVSDGTATDTIAVVMAVKSGWAVVDVVSATTTDGTIGFLWGAAPEDYSQWYYPTANNTSILPDGTISTDQTTGTIGMLIWNIATGNWDPFTITLSAEEGGSPAGNRSAAAARSSAYARTAGSARRVAATRSSA